MATTLGSSGHAGSATGGWDRSLWYDSGWYKFGMALMLAVAILCTWFQRTFNRRAVMNNTRVQI